MGAAPSTGRRRPTRRGALGSLLGLAAGGLAAGVAGRNTIAADKSAVPVPLPIAQATPIEVSTRPFSSFMRLNPHRTKFGRLEFRGGLTLTSTARDFGGWSGLYLEPDGRRLLTISDEGSWMTAALGYRDGHPDSLTQAVIGSIVGLGGRALAKKRDLDAEGLTLLDGTLSHGTVLISFERNHRIGRYPIDERGLGPPLGYLRMPPEARQMRPNAGFESVGVIRGGELKGSIIAFSEDFRDAARNHLGWIWQSVGAEPQRLALTDIADFAITDVASLDDGTLLVLERKFRWTEGVKMRIRQLSAASVRPGKTLDGEVLLEADLGYEIDNMEGLAVSREPGTGAVILTLISDDNFNHLLQRTLLLQFELTGQRKGV